VLRSLALLTTAALAALALLSAGPAAAAPSLPACALGAGSEGLRGFYASELTRAQARLGGAAAARRAFAAGLAAYVYGLAPVAVGQTVLRFPENQLVSIGALADPSVKTVVLPNNDTTYTPGRLNLARGPQVIDVPDTAGRYYVIQLLDAYSNTFAYIGRRTTGTGGGSFAVVPPGFGGTPPAGVREIQSPTDVVWVLGRTLVRGPADLPAVTSLMRGYTVTALGPWTSGQRQAPVLLPSFPATPPTPVPEGLAFFDALGAVLASNPPPRGDRCALRAFAAAGVGAGRAPSREAGGAVRRGLEAAAAAGPRLVERAEQLENRASRARSNGWLVPGPYIGDYGRNWLGRAIIARSVLGANTRRETVYPLALTDSRGRPLDGRRGYALRFPRGGLPPVGAFWSLTMYDENRYLVENPIDRYSIGDRTRGLRRGRGGSLTVYIQRRRPRAAAARANWLPAPAGRFRLALRLYEPKRRVLNGRWLPPPLERRR
jgi:hypothetical protein